MVESVVSLVIVFQCLWIVDLNRLLMSEKGAAIGGMLVSVCGVC